jgi:hypothetical protein
VDKETLKNNYDYELELLCGDLSIDSKDDFKTIHNKFIKIKNSFNKRVFLEEQFNDDEILCYCNCSLFCNGEELDFFKKQVDDFNIVINVLHDNLDHFMKF